MMLGLLQWVSPGSIDGGRIERVSVVATGFPMWLVVLLGIAVVGIGVWTYRREAELTRRRRGVLIGLRSAGLAVLVLLLARPVLQLELSGAVMRRLVVLIDDSASMGQVDERLSEEDRARLLAVMGEDGARASGASEASRIDLVHEAMFGERLRLLETLEKSHRVELRRFARSSEPIARDSDESRGGDTRLHISDGVESTASAIGEALAEVIEPARAAELTGVLVVSDGVNTRGVEPMRVARMARERGVPIFAWGVGVVDRADVAIVRAEGPEVGFVDDELSLQVEVASPGFEGRQVRMRGYRSDVQVAEERVTLDGSSRQRVTLRFAPEEAGSEAVRLVVDEMEGEASSANNVMNVPLEVVGRKIRVLWVEREPRWEFKYAQAALLRDRRVELKCVLTSGDAGIALIEGSPYLSGFPDEMGGASGLAGYDLLVLGDVGASDFSARQLQMIERFVGELGGGLVMVAGRERMPQTFRGTAMEPLVPTEIPLRGVSESSAVSEAKRRSGVRWMRTNLGAGDGMLRLEANDAADAATWARLPEIFWHARVGRARPAARVLVQTAEGADEGEPLVILQPYGLGQTLLIATDQLWRVRRNEGDRLHARLWGQIVTRMTLANLLGDSKRTRILPSVRKIEPGGRVKIVARLLDEGLDPLREPSVMMVVREADGSSRRVAMQSIADQPGSYVGEWTASVPGRAELRVEGRDEGAASVNVIEPMSELSRVSLDMTMLEAIASESGGLAVREPQLADLPRLIESRRAPVRSMIESPVWSSFWALILVLLFFSLEWFLRRRWQLR